MPKTRDQKENIVKYLSDKLSRSKSVVFADYKGLTMTQLSALRKQLQAEKAEFTITKNTLLSLALKNSKFSPPPAGWRGGLHSQFLAGPLAALFSYEEEISPIKLLSKSFKDAQIGSIKGGFLEGEYLDSEKINQLALLPSKDELRAKVVGSLGSPLYGIVGVLQANLRNLVYVINAIQQ